MHVPRGHLIAIALLTVWQVVLLVGLPASPGFLEWSGSVPAALGLAASLVGVLLAIPRPEAGFVLGSLGTLVVFLAMPWALPFFLPLPVVLGVRLARTPVSNPAVSPGA